MGAGGSYLTSSPGPHLGGSLPSAWWMEALFREPSSKQRTALVYLDQNVITRREGPNLMKVLLTV